jgi:hypothetical protein
VFAGPKAERRARDYFDALKFGRLKTVRAPPDGYTLLMTDPSPTIGASLYDKLLRHHGRDGPRDFA